MSEERCPKCHRPKWPHHSTAAKHEDYVTYCVHEGGADCLRTQLATDQRTIENIESIVGPGKRLAILRHGKHWVASVWGEGTSYCEYSCEDESLGTAIEELRKGLGK